MPICLRRSADNINTSPRLGSSDCAAPDIMPVLRRLRRPSANTSPAISTVTTATGRVMYDFDKHLSALAKQTVLCVGDLMLDEFVYGDVSRISPEAPTPVIVVKRTELMIGGAGNVARNLVSLGARCVFIGAVGDDEAGSALTKALGTHPLIEFYLVIDGKRQTTRKVRFVSEHHSTHLLRADWELAEVLNPRTEKALIDRALAALPGAASVA